MKSPIEQRDPPHRYAATVGITLATAALCGMGEFAVSILHDELVMVSAPGLIVAMTLAGLLAALTIGLAALITARVCRLFGLPLDPPAAAIGIHVTIWIGVAWHVALLPGDPWHSSRGLVGSLIAFALGAVTAALLTRVSRRVLLTGLGSLVVLLAMIDLTIGGVNPIDRPQPETPRSGWTFLIVCDTLSARHMSAYGYDRETTPFVELLANEMVVFDRAIAASSWTRPSVASLMTSTPVRSHQTDAGTGLLRSGITTIGERFREAGYPTAAFVTNSVVTYNYGFDQGFSHFDDLLARPSVAMMGLRPMWLSWGPLRSFQLRNRVLRHARRRRGDELNLRFFDWFDRNELSGGFIWLHYMDCHAPYYAPAETPGFGTKLPDLYDTSIRYWDGAVENLVAFLKDRGVWDEATVVLTSDHGEEFLEHGEHGHGETVYEEVIHVPLMVKAPQARPRRVATAVSLVDIAPTLIELADLESLPAGHDRSLGPYLLGDDPDRGPVVSEILNAHDRVRIAVVDDPWKLILWPDSGEVELYNLIDDPGEQHPAAEPDPEISRRLLESAVTWPIDLTNLRAPPADGITEKARADPNEALRVLGYLSPD